MHSSAEAKIPSILRYLAGCKYFEPKGRWAWTPEVVWITFEILKYLEIRVHYLVYTWLHMHIDWGNHFQGAEPQKFSQSPCAIAHWPMLIRGNSNHMSVQNFTLMCLADWWLHLAARFPTVKNRELTVKKYAMTVKKPRISWKQKSSKIKRKSNSWINPLTAVCSSRCGSQHTDSQDEAVAGSNFNFVYVCRQFWVQTRRDQLQPWHLRCAIYLSLSRSWPGTNLLWWRSTWKFRRLNVSLLCAMCFVLPRALWQPLGFVMKIQTFVFFHALNQLTPWTMICISVMRIFYACTRHIKIYPGICKQLTIYLIFRTIITLYMRYYETLNNV